MPNNDIDKSNMYQSIYDFSKHIEESFSWFKNNSKIDIDSFNEIKSIMILGMGGSAITGLLVKEIFKNDLTIPVYVNQGYEIPKWVNKNTLIIACSYSGNTEETLISCKKAFSNTSNLICLSKGAKLYDLFKENKILNFVKMPSGLQPRAALGFSLSLMLLLLKKLDIIDISYINNLKNSIKPIEKLTRHYSNNNNDNIAYVTAKNIYNKNPLIYAEEGIFNIIGYRFKCQLVENAKILAFNNEIPEMNHNEIEAFTNDVNKNKNFIVIWIKDSSYNDRNLKRVDIVYEIWKEKKEDQLTIKLESLDNNKILKYLSYIHLLDWVSYHSAILNSIDPSIIPNINKLKKSL